jgi:site-specific recombinase XerD
MAKSKTRGIFEKPPGSGVWWVSYFSSGKRVREKVGRRSKAEETYYERRAEIAAGTWIPPKSRKTSLLFGELAKASLAEKQMHLRPRTYDTDRGRWNKLSPRLGELRVQDVTHQIITAALEDLKRSGNAGSTVNRYRALLSTFFTYGIRTEKIKMNPMARVKRFKEPQNRVRYLTAEEEKRLRAEIRAKCPEHEPELDLALNTGMRRGEQFTLQWKNVSIPTAVAGEAPSGLLIVEGKSGKRPVTANSKAIEALGKLRALRPNAIRVTNDSKTVTTRDGARWFEKCVKAAGIDDFHWHDLRHTYASRLVMSGANIVSVKDLMGHKDIKMTMRYTHLRDDHRKSEAEKIVGAT